MPEVTEEAKQEARETIKERLRPIFVLHDIGWVRVKGLHEVMKGETYKMVGEPDDPYLSGFEVAKALSDGKLLENGSAQIECEVLEAGEWADTEGTVN